MSDPHASPPPHVDPPSGSPDTCGPSCGCRDDLPDDGRGLSVGAAGRPVHGGDAGHGHGVTGPLADASVRRARPADAPAVGLVQAEVWRDAYGDLLPEEVVALFDGPAFARAWRPGLESPPSPRHVLLVACAGAQVVGFAALAPSGDPGTPRDTGEIVAAGVHPAARRAGHGSRLLNAVADTARGLGVAALTAWLPADAVQARIFLTDAGLALDGARRERIVSPDGDTLPEVRLGVALTPPDRPSA